MSARTVQITPANSIRNHSHKRHMHPHAHSTHEHIHSTEHNATYSNTPTIHPPPPVASNNVNTTPHTVPTVKHPHPVHHRQTASSVPRSHSPSSRPDPLFPHLTHQHPALTILTDNLSPPLLNPPPPSPKPCTNPNPTPPLSPTQIYELLSPRLLHHQSLLTAVHDLLAPLHSSFTLPLPTLTTLHHLLSDSPHLLSLLPPLPASRTRPTRAPPVSYADPHEPQALPMPCPVSFPFGKLDGVAVAPSTLSTPDLDAGMGLFGIRHND